jgi:hypothetical protein
MREVATKVYLVDELSDTAKEKARAWYAEKVFDDCVDFSFLYEDIAACAKCLGISINYPGNRPNKPQIYFQGFYSQGDGAMFEGSYSYRRDAVKDIRKHAPQDEELHRIADVLATLQLEPEGGSMTARMSHQGRYYHSGCMQVEVEWEDPEVVGPSEWEDELIQLMRDFADWIYSQLRKEYEYQISDEVVDEALRANEYEFTEDGERY